MTNSTACPFGRRRQSVTTRPQGRDQVRTRRLLRGRPDLRVTRRRRHHAQPTGSYTWVPITDAAGAALPGAITVTDPNGVTSVDARNTTELPGFKGTDYQRPEDMQIQTVHG